MPNLVVYVPAKLWQRLEEKLGTEFPAWARQMTIRHMEDFLDSGGGATAVPPERSVEHGRASNPPPDDLHFKPDFGKKLK